MPSFRNVANSRTYPLAGFVAATVSRQPLPTRSIAMWPFLVALLRGLDCAIYSISAIVFLALGVFSIIAQPGAAVLGVVSLAAGVISGGLVTVRFVHVYRALQIGEAVEAEIVRSAVGLVRLTGTLWGDLINGTAVRGCYKIRGADPVVAYYLQQRWARSLKPGMKIWVISVNGRPAFLAPFDSES
jgi:hypothetical protein